MPRRTLAQRRDDAAREMALVTELVAGTPGQRDAEWWVAVAGRVCARHRVRSLKERAGGVAPPPAEPMAPRSVNDLSPAETRTLQSLADHGNALHAAAALHLSPSTVRTNLTRARLRLGVHSNLAAVAAALRAGLIT